MQGESRSTLVAIRSVLRGRRRWSVYEWMFSLVTISRRPGGCGAGMNGSHQYTL